MELTWYAWAFEYTFLGEASTINSDCSYLNEVISYQSEIDEGAKYEKIKRELELNSLRHNQAIHTISISCTSVIVP